MEEGEGKEEREGVQIGKVHETHEDKDLGCSNLTRLMESLPKTI